MSLKTEYPTKSSIASKDLTLIADSENNFSLALATRSAIQDYLTITNGFISSLKRPYGAKANLSSTTDGIIIADSDRNFALSRVTKTAYNTFLSGTGASVSSSQKLPYPLKTTLTRNDIIMGVDGEYNDTRISAVRAKISEFIGPVVADAATSRIFNGVRFTENNTDTYYAVADGDALDIADSNFTILALVNFNQPVGPGSNNQMIINLGAAGASNNLQLYFGLNKPSCRFGPSSGTATLLTGSNDVSSTTNTDNWMIVGVRRTSSTLEVFHCLKGAGAIVSDGSTTLAATGAVQPLANKTRIGARDFDLNQNLGFCPLSYVAIVPSSLTDQNIVDLAAGKHIQTDLSITPQAYWDFSSGASTINNTGSVSGSAATLTGSNVELVGGPNYTTAPLSITEKQYKQVFQKEASATTGQVTFTGTYRGSPAGIEARIVDKSGTQVVGWSDCVYTSKGGWYWINESVPKGGWYSLEVRVKEDTSVMKRSHSPFGVGDIVFITGQSNADRWFSNTNTGYDATGKLFSEYANGWNGLQLFKLTTVSVAREFAARLSDIVNHPIMVVDAAQTATALIGDSEADVWGNPTSDVYVDNFVTPLSTVGGDIGLIYWAQGEAEAEQSETEAAYEAAFAPFSTKMRTDVGRTASQLPILMYSLGKKANASPDGFNAIRNAQRDISYGGSAITNVIFAGPTYDAALSDTIHYTAAGYRHIMGRALTAYLNSILPETYTSGMRGAELTSASGVGGSTVTCTFTLNNGTQLQDASGGTGAVSLTGFIVRDSGGTARTITGTNINSATTVQITVSTTLAAGDTVEYCQVSNPDTTNPLYTNVTVVGSSLTLPAMSTRAAISIS